MKLADRMNAPKKGTAPRSAVDASPLNAPSMTDVAARIAAEVSGPLTAAPERVMALADSGRIDRAGLRSLRPRLEDQAPGIAFIEIVPAGSGCEIGGTTGHRITRLGAESLRQMLAPVVLLELARRR